MTLEIPKDKWADFFDDFTKRRFGWETRIEVLQESVGDQILSARLPLNGITFSPENGLIEISVGDNTAQHQTHNLTDPVRVAFLDDGRSCSGVLEITETNGIRTLVRILNPMPVVIGYTNYQIMAPA